jgi:hypothetical protein
MCANIDRNECDAASAFEPTTLACEGLQGLDELPNLGPVVQLTQPPCSDYVVIGLDRGPATLAHAPPHPNRMLGETPCGRAIAKIVMPGCMISSTNRNFCSAL